MKHCKNTRFFSVGTSSSGRFLEPGKGSDWWDLSAASQFPVYIPYPWNIEGCLLLGVPSLPRRDSRLSSWEFWFQQGIHGLCICSKHQHTGSAPLSQLCTPGRLDLFLIRNILIKKREKKTNKTEIISKQYFFLFLKTSSVLFWFYHRLQRFYSALAGINTCRVAMVTLRISLTFQNVAFPFFASPNVGTRFKFDTLQKCKLSCSVDVFQIMGQMKCCLTCF